jgi:hypothetical protein
MKWDYDDLRDAKGKGYMLRFLPYSETPDGREAETTIGYHRAPRGYRWGRWEEFFRTLPEAQKRMKFLVSHRTVEDIELRKAVPGQGMCTVLLDEWREEREDTNEPRDTSADLRPEELTRSERDLVDHLFRGFGGGVYRLVAWRRNDGPWMVEVQPVPGEARREPFTVSVRAIDQTYHHSRNCGQDNCPFRR